MALAWPVMNSCRLGSPADRRTTVFLSNHGVFVSWRSILFWKASSAFLVVLEVCGYQAGAASSGSTLGMLLTIENGQRDASKCEDGNLTKPLNLVNQSAEPSYPSH
ncbi:hypothetical protein J6590_056859 [Homalodisca vitripennis]|nr:hypothetical protein J6590_075406 [Homalodisca vitripennis]KAG8291606.1 hypothetical protein J6590_056859 [Homalodisca vitripennis]